MQMRGAARPESWERLYPPTRRLRTRVAGHRLGGPHPLWLICIVDIPPVHHETTCAGTASVGPWTLSEKAKPGKLPRRNSRRIAFVLACRCGALWARGLEALDGRRKATLDKSRECQPWYPPVVHPDEMRS